MVLFSIRQYQELKLNLNSWKQTIGPFPKRQWIARLRFMVAKALPVFCSSLKLGEACAHFVSSLKFQASSV
jgi:hypothetical protein